MMELERDLLGKPYRLGASGPDAWDCWHLTRELLFWLYGLRLQDPTERIHQLWQQGRLEHEDVTPGDEWEVVGDHPMSGDIVLSHGADGEQGVGLVHDGYVWTATRRHGVVRIPVARFHRVKCWRRCA